MSLVWFREDLRLADNPAWTAALAAGPVVAVFVFDEATPGLRPIGAASRWWLHHSLTALDKQLGGALVMRRGPAREVIETLIAETGALALYCNRLYEAPAIARDAEVEQALKARGVAMMSFNASLLHEPTALNTRAEEPYKVFTPFWRAAVQRQIDAPSHSPPHTGKLQRASSEVLRDWRLTPSAPDWAKAWPALWRPGESGAHARLDAFIDTGLDGYASFRDRLDRRHVSRLSPHLRWGEISPRQVWSAVQDALALGAASARDAEAFLRELGWREFSYHLLFHYPDLASRNWRATFDAYPWRSDARDLEAWQSGRTGYPLVDAGMREMWATGYMHGRARMAAASFLVKHLRIDWRLGEAWFWDALIDADPANNAASWQWVAGSGADAAPYFRIFNPVLQGRKFDPDGAYVRRWVPELTKLSHDCLHAPFTAPDAALVLAGVRLGETYPRPIVDHASARAAALAGYEHVKRNAPA